jgi:glutamyl/glutaminyl-tRNA synthetase
VGRGQILFDDLIHGKMNFDSAGIGDFIIVRSDGMASYNFACVIDDHSMGITHVIRGEDHLSNTPRQLLLYQALSWQPPLFAHHPLILGPDRSPKKCLKKGSLKKSPKGVSSVVTIEVVDMFTTAGRTASETSAKALLRLLIVLMDS